MSMASRHDLSPELLEQLRQVSESTIYRPFELVRPPAELGLAIKALAKLADKDESSASGGAKHQTEEQASKERQEEIRVRLLDAIKARRQDNGQDASSAIIIREAHVSRNDGITVLRQLEDEGLYKGFSRPRRNQRKKKR
jgi:hypothetical protein